MKEITDYFSSPTKNMETNIELRNSTTESSKKDEIVENIKNTSTSCLSICKNSSIPEESQRKRKRRKADKLRKLSDPAVKTVTELFSNGLCLLSPNKQCVNAKSTDNEDEKNLSCVKNVPEKGIENIESIEIISTNDEKISKKTNAFQFMMDSRNKSIGTNSPGKEVHKEKSQEDTLNKQKLVARKNLLNSWAEQKGASKRKRAEDELDEVINYKLEKRAKRLQRLLKAEKIPNESKRSSKIIVNNTRNKIAKISFSSNSSDSENDFDSKQKNNVVPKKKKEKVENKSRVSKVTKINREKNVETNFIRKKVNRRKADSSVPEKEDEQKILCKTKSGSGKIVQTVEQEVSTSLKSKESQQSTLSFDGVSDENCITKQSDIKKKCTINEKKRKHVRTSNSIAGTTTKIKCDEIIIVEDNFKKKSNKMKKKPKNHNDESIQNDISTQRSQSWKMKIKMNLEEGVEVSNKEENRELRRNKIINYIDDSSRDSSEEIYNHEKIEEDTFTVISSESEEDSNSKKTPIKNAKIAPVFIRATPKPKEDPTVREAKRQFLMSGIPSSLKRVIEKQQSIEEREHDIFPTISHVQQKCENRFWNLPDPELKIKESKPLRIDQSNLICQKITKSHIPQKLNIKTEVEKIDKLKFLLNKIKSDNPNYPVYKSFRSIYEKSGKTSTDKSEKKVSSKRTKKGKKNKLNSSCEIIDPSSVPTDPDFTKPSMWTEKYKPKCSDDIVGNTEAVKKLKKWLVTWMKYSKDINSKRKKEGSSGSDFDTSDCDSKDSTTLPGNTVVLGGPCGSGKSSAVYAICNELDFNIIELNASSKRTGKRLLQEIREATQSHQVRKNKSQFFVDKNSKEKLEDTESQTNKRMCVLLIEDIDIIFEQDDGFISALTQLITTSKRPVILTTTDYDSVFVRKFLNEYEYIPFLSLSSYSLATWLQIVCLIEGVYVQQSEVGGLLELNKGDVRKTLLQLQFWVSSGGQVFENGVPIKLKHKRSSCEEKLADDEEPNSFPIEKTNECNDIFIHKHCIGSFEIFHDHGPFIVPYYLNLGMLWWNIPNIIDLPDFTRQRIQKYQQETQYDNTETVANGLKSTSVDKMKLSLASKLYDALTFTDVMFRKVDYFDSIEPVVKNINCRIGDSLELGEDFSTFSGNTDFVHEITHNLVDGHIKIFSGITGAHPQINMAVPNKAERRWRAKSHACEDAFLEALCISNKLERKPAALDYMPVLRNIYRTERIRASNNTKRGNRFRNYLKYLGVDCNSSSVKPACNIMRENNFL